MAQADLNDTSSWVYVGWRDVGRGLRRSPPGNPFAVVVESERSEVLERYSRFLTAAAPPRACSPHMTGKKLLCHCLPGATCHTDRIIEECKLGRLAEPTRQLVDRGGWEATLVASLRSRGRVRFRSVELFLVFSISVPHRSFSFVGRRFTFVFFQPDGFPESLTKLLALGFGPLGLPESPAPPLSPSRKQPVKTPGRRGWRDLCGGAGLCSLGRWSLSERYPGWVFLEITKRLRERLLKEGKRNVQPQRTWKLNGLALELV